MLADAVDRLGWDRETVRVIDLAAGNGISGQALAAHGLHPVLGTDIVPEARAAALRTVPASTTPTRPSICWRWGQTSRCASRRSRPTR